MQKLVIRRDGALEKEVELAQRDLRIGRGEQNDIVLTDATKGVSRVHAELRYENGRYALIDLNSQNGIWAQGQRQQKITLEPGVPVTVGSFTLELEGPASAPAGETVPAAADAMATLVHSSQIKRAPAPAAVVTPQRARSSAAKGGTDKAGQAPAPGLIARLARLPKPLLFGGVAGFMILIMALGQIFAPADNSTNAPASSAAPVAKEPTVDPKDVIAEHLSEARALIDQREFAVAIREHLDPVLLMDPASADALDLKGKANEAMTSAATTPTPASSAAGSATSAGGRAQPVPSPSSAASPKPAAAGDPTRAMPARSAAPRTPPVTASAEPTPQLPAPLVQQRPNESEADWRARDLATAGRYDRAKAALDGGSFQNAVTQLSEIQRDEPGYKDVATLITQAREGVHRLAQQALDAGAKAEASGDWVGAVQHYDQAAQIEPSTAAGAEESARRVRARMKTEGTDAFTRAKQYDAVRRVPEAVALYERAYRYLTDDDPNRKVAKDRLDALRK